ncbi:MAG: ABC transporter permease, partial [Flavobacteriales bacterium]
YLSFIFSFALFPYLYLIVLNHFRYQNPHYIEAAQSLGKSMIVSILKIKIPIMLPAVFAGLSIVSMEILNNFGAVSYFGISTFTTEIVRHWNPMDSGKSMAIALALLFTVGLFFVFENRYKSKRQGVEQDLQTEINTIDLKPKYQVLVVFWTLIPLVFGFLLPFVQLVYWAAQDLSFIVSKELIDLTINTLKFSSLTIACCLLSAFAYLYVIRFYSNTLHRHLAKWSTLGYAFPGVLVAIAVLQFGSGLQFFGLELKNILSFLLIFAYIIRFQSIALNSMLSAAEKSPLVLHEASQSLGFSRWQSIKKIEWPLLKPSVWSAALLIFVELSKELPLTIMFQQFNFETLAIHAYQLMLTDGAIYQAALPSLIIVLLGLLPLWLINKLL